MSLSLPTYGRSFPGRSFKNWEVTAPDWHNRAVPRRAVVATAAQVRRLHRPGFMTGTPARVLIVDDDEVVTETFARILRLEGHQVRTALSAESGLREADASLPDAIILDLRMPLINGLGFLYRLRACEQHRATPVAIVTGDYCLDDTVSSELDQLGAEVHFKPIWLDDLVDLAHALLTPNRRPTRRQASLPN